jgi:acyl carrier protein
MNKLNQIMSEVFRMNEEELKDELTMKNVENWDSLKHMDLILSIEKGLDIQFSMDDILKMKDIKTIRKIVKDKIILNET